MSQSLLKGLDEGQVKEEFKKVLAHLQEKQGTENDVVNTEMNELDCEWYIKECEEKIEQMRKTFRKWSCKRSASSASERANEAWHVL